MYDMKPKYKRDVPVSIRFSVVERAKLDIAAISDGRTLSDWARRVLLIASDLRKRKGGSR